MKCCEVSGKSLFKSIHSIGYQIFTVIKEYGHIHGAHRKPQLAEERCEVVDGECKVPTCSITRLSRPFLRHLVPGSQREDTQVISTALQLPKSGHIFLSG